MESQLGPRKFLFELMGRERAAREAKANTKQITAGNDLSIQYPCALKLYIYIPLVEEPEEISTRLSTVQWNVAGVFKLRQEGIKRASRGQPKPLELRFTPGQIVGSDLKFEALKRTNVYSHLLFSTVRFKVRVPSWLGIIAGFALTCVRGSSALM